MTDQLDDTAAMANAPGWTKEAKRLQAQERKAQKKTDKAATKARKTAEFKAFWAGVGGGFVAVWDFFMRNLLLAFAISGVAGVAVFEWVNGGNGWQDLYPGIWPVFVWAGAFGVIMLFFVSATKALSEIEKGEGKRELVPLIGWTVAAILAFVISVTGVFISTATNSVEAQNAAKASRIEFATLKGQVAALETDLETYTSEYWTGIETQLKRSIDSRLAIAKNTFALPDLDATGACAQPKLNFQQQRMCVRMNGGDDPTTGEAILGIRTELENVQREIKSTAAKEEKLAELRAEVKGFKVKQGDETAVAMGQMIEDQSGEKTLTNVYWILSSFLLLLSGWGNHWAIGEIQRLTLAARIRKGKAA